MAHLVHDEKRDRSQGDDGKDPHGILRAGVANNTGICFTEEERQGPNSYKYREEGHSESHFIGRRMKLKANEIGKHIGKSAHSNVEQVNDPPWSMFSGEMKRHSANIAEFTQE